MGSLNNHSTTRGFGFLFLVALLIGFVAGVFAGNLTRNRGPLQSLQNAVQKLTGSNPHTDYSLLTTSWDLIQTKYVNRPIDPQQLIRGAIEGLVESLDDPYSFYLTPDEANLFEDEINGRFEGIGAELGLKQGKIVVIAPLPDTPAERAGIRTGDVIASIDGVPTEGMTLEQAVLKIRGKEGTEVTLVIDRTETEDNVSLTIKRARIHVKSVVTEFRQAEDTSIAVITISSFTQESDQEFNQVVRSILLRQPGGVILDLRNNPGGYLDSAVAVADAFLKDGPIVIEDFGNGQRRPLTADSASPLAPFPVVILINGGTASASEIVAGALQDRLNATVIGEKSFGKGTVQEIEDLSDGSTIKLTVAQWLTPNGRSIEGSGIEPNVSLTRTQEDIDADRDPPLQRALEILSSGRE